MARQLDQTFVDQISNLANVKTNMFTSQGFSVGNLLDYRMPDLAGVPQPNIQAIASNEVVVSGEKFHQYLIPLHTNEKLIGTIAVLNSERIVQKNTLEMIGILALIATSCLFLILPFGWYLANSISQPITRLSRIFRDIASGKEFAANELSGLNYRQSDELIELTQSFIGMHEVINQKIAQINEINSSLEATVQLRTNELQLANDELTKLSMRDALTQLPNRRMFNDRFDYASAQSKRTNQYGAIIFIDLDNFKPLNDQYGHGAGDLLLIEVARRLTGSVRETDTVARFGGDEFVVMLSKLEEEKSDATAHAATLAEKLLTTLCEPYEIVLTSGTGEKNVVHHCTASIGVVMFINHEASSEELLRRADAAMYQAKEAGRNQVRFFEQHD
ncbi:diguanylate cyclase [Sideroxydans sp.]